MRPVIFFDDGGVLNDNRRRGPEWQRLVGEYFVPRYGGSPQLWAEANIYALEKYLYRMEQKRATGTTVDSKFFDGIDTKWIQDMFDHAKIQPPPEKMLLAIARNAIRWILPRVKSGFDGMDEVVRYLHSAGYVLHTASAELEYELDGYLQGMGIRHCFDQLYGCDKLGRLKQGREFYEEIFERLQISPEEAVIIEDDPRMIKIISQLGALPVQSRLTGEYDAATRYSFSTPQELQLILTRDILL